MEWRDCDDDPPEEDGQRVRVLIHMEIEMYYLPSCKKFKWLLAKEGRQKTIGWKPIEGGENYYDRES